MAAYNREHSPLRFAELEEIFTDTRDWNALRRNILQCKEQLTVAQNTRNLAEQNLERIRQDTMRPDSAKGETRESLKAALLDTNTRIAESSERLGQIKSLIERHEKAIHETALMQSRIKAAEENNEWWQRLNTMFGSADGKKFREIAQSFTFEHLVMRANEQLLQLSPRYRLCTIPGTLMLQIIDRDMFDQQRYVSSLSGGETFVVSLALALALSGLSAEGLTIGSLFIDEGFGTLDPDTLDTVIDSLSMLQASQGKKVGVISHTNTMSERITTQIRVIKNGNTGSSHIEIYPQ
jgi:exonuclease SbcC